MTAGECFNSRVGKLLAQNVYDLIEKQEGPFTFEEQHWLFEISNSLNIIFMAKRDVTCAKRLTMFDPDRQGKVPYNLDYDVENDSGLFPRICQLLFPRTNSVNIGDN